MKIITKNGKDYLKTSVKKINNFSVDCFTLFNDIEEYLDKNENSNLQHFYDRFSCSYFSPSFMKSYMENPMNTIFNSVSSEGVNDATAIGTTYHKIMEDYYSLPKEERNREVLDKLEKDLTPFGMDQKRLHQYVEGYKDIKDYLNEDSELDDTNLDCFCEYKGKTQVYIPKFDITLPIPLSYIVDRIDVRDGKLYILDYKTGRQGRHSATFDGYLGSMILYKWVIEQDFGMEVDKGYLIAPHLDNKYIELDYSLVNESKLVDDFYDFYEQFKKDTETRVYSFTNKGYFTSDDMRKYRRKMQDSSVDTINIEIYIGESEEKEDENTVKMEDYEIPF